MLRLRSLKVRARRSVEMVALQEDWNSVFQKGVHASRAEPKPAVSCRPAGPCKNKHFLRALSNLLEVTHAQKTTVGFTPSSDQRYVTLKLCIQKSHLKRTEAESNFNKRCKSCLCRSRWPCGLWRRSCRGC